MNTDFSYRPIDADTATVTFFEALTNRDLYEEATGNDDYIRAGIQHTTSASLNRLIPSQFINTSANISYNEYWFPTSIRKTLDRETNQVETEKIPGFASGRDFSTGLNFSTTIYGISNRKIGKLEAFVIPFHLQ